MDYTIRKYDIISSQSETVHLEIAMMNVGSKYLIICVKSRVKASNWIQVFLYVLSLTNLHVSEKWLSGHSFCNQFDKICLETEYFIHSVLNGLPIVLIY